MNIYTRVTNIQNSFKKIKTLIRKQNKQKRKLRPFVIPITRNNYKLKMRYIIPDIFLYVWVMYFGSDKNRVRPWLGSSVG